MRPAVGFSHKIAGIPGCSTSQVSRASQRIVCVATASRDAQTFGKVRTGAAFGQCNTSLLQKKMNETHCVLDVLNLFFWGCLNFKLHVINGCCCKQAMWGSEASSFLHPAEQGCPSGARDAVVQHFSRFTACVEQCQRIFIYIYMHDYYTMWCLRNSSMHVTNWGMLEASKKKTSSICVLFKEIFRGKLHPDSTPLRRAVCTS